MAEHEQPPREGEARDELVVSGTRRSRNLVFTSAGDRANVDQWVAGNAEFDLWVTYYGDEAQPAVASNAQYFNRRKGSKYQNLYHAWRSWPELLRQYDAVFVMDDDILIKTQQINRLFRCREELDAWVLQPGFDPRGKMSHPHTRAHGGVRYRWVNFVENNVPLFRADKLWAFMEQYDPSVTCWGIDWWYTEVLGLSATGRAAVVDEIVCLNPLDRKKGGMRELDRLFPTDQRRERWEKLQRERGLKGVAQGKQCYESYPLQGHRYVTSMLRAAMTLAIAFPRRCGRVGKRKGHEAQEWAAWTRGSRRRRSA